MKAPDTNRTPRHLFPGGDRTASPFPVFGGSGGNLPHGGFQSRRLLLFEPREQGGALSRIALHGIGEPACELRGDQGLQRVAAVTRRDLGFGARGKSDKILPAGTSGL
ncbi:hypothetical protein JDN40_02265 [Rhodomicrobium vannielii ATCC 17100]|uniref:hypothetical protein n=1 Tax=Rhodomicrobium vannielii TaxID=1069 RepID=UPI00191B3DBA|nr:hypothetical protein [Rhodomicrobium vannielii]MBJ7532939.1 hypothetical protein [Rhodomicrobium vannielii ATCC 17100]